VLPANSVGNKQLKKNAVTAVKVKNGSLLAADFRASSFQRVLQVPRAHKDLKVPSATRATPD
jgi:hypothetical protein